jgi:hypothetical protein
MYKEFKRRSVKAGEHGAGEAGGDRGCERRPTKRSMGRVSSN